MLQPADLRDFAGAGAGACAAAPSDARSPTSIRARPARRTTRARSAG